MMPATLESISMMLGLVIVLVLFSRYEAQNQDSSAVVSTQNNQFTVDFFKKIEDSDANVISSPFSVSTVLSMLLVGAKGQTETEMKTALEYSDLTQDAINDGYQKILPALNGGNNYTLNLANAIFVNSQFKVLDSFNATLTQYYQSQSYQLTGVEQVNSFVSQNTNGKIPTILDDLPDNTQIVLINAIYFYGKWKTQFDKQFSVVQPFTNEDGTSTNTNLMHVTSNFQYEDNQDLNSQILVLPYVGETVKFIVILPEDSTANLAETEELLNGVNLVSTAQNAVVQKVIVTLPKFKIESSFDLKDPLMQSGMKVAFSDAANFSGVSDITSIKVSKVVQKAIIEVNEEGTEAAAATAVVGVRTAAVEEEPVEPIVFLANRPFLFALYHQPTNSVLFIGKYTKAS